MRSSSPRVLFIYLKETSFVQEDWILLEENYDVRAFHFDAEEATSIWGLLRLWIRQFIWLCRELPEAELTVCWFADHHALLPVLLAEWFGVPSAVILGGMDCNWLPEYNYGVWDSRWRAPLVRIVVRHASLLPTVSSSLVESEETYSNWPESRQNGIRVHVPTLDTPHPVIPIGFDPSVWPEGPPERSRQVTTVALIDSWRTFRIKGIDLLLAAATRLPESNVQVVGISSEFAGRLVGECAVPSNVDFHPPRPRGELREVYQKTSVYAQLSRVEAFGLVVGEAMLSGCIPVVSNVGQLPDLVGETGVIVERPDPDAIATAVDQAFSATPDARQQARSRIETRFPRRRRRNELLGVLEKLRG